MTKIQIIKKSDGYAYKYGISIDNKTAYITKSGFKTLEEALEEAKKSYNKRISTNQKPIHTEQKTHKKEKIKHHLRIKNLHITDAGFKLAELAVFSSLVLTAFFGTLKIIKDFKDKFPEPEDTNIETDLTNNKEIINQRDCDFTNLHIVLRAAKNETLGTATVTSDILTRLGVSNEVVYKDSDLSAKVATSINDNPNSDIVVINIETGCENPNNTIIMGDSSNRREYPSDILASCLKESLNEYNLDPVIKSGKESGIWREQTSIEKELTDSTLINNVSQLTISLPTAITEDNIYINDAAASIVEGIMRWTTLDIHERYKDIYYTTLYGDTLVTIMNEHHLSIEDIDKNSDIDMHKGVRVGNTVLVGSIPKVATNEVIVYNPYVTTNKDAIEERIIEYTVQSGDTLTKIANMYGVEIEDIIVPSKNPNNIYIGDKLYITTYSLYETHGKTDSKTPKQL